MDVFLFASTDWIGIGLGFGLIGAVLAFAALLHMLGLCSTFVTRKVVHIGVGHWWLVAWHFHDSMIPALVGPVVFTIVNALFYRYRRFAALGHEGSGENFGIVLYPISLILLVIATWTGPLSQSAAAAGVLIMAWGDGSAAIVGRKLGGASVSGGKTVPGSLAMFVVSAIVVVVIALAGSFSGLLHVVGAALVVALLAVLTERFTPWGMDNLSVPVVSAAAFMVFIGT